MIFPGVLLGLLFALKGSSFAQEVTTDISGHYVSSVTDDLATDSEALKVDDLCTVPSLEDWLLGNGPYTELTKNDTVQLLAKARQERKLRGKGSKSRKKLFPVIKIGGHRPFGMPPPDADLEVTLINSDLHRSDFFISLDESDQGSTCGVGEVVKKDNPEALCTRIESSMEAGTSQTIAIHTPECGCIIIRAYLSYKKNESQFLLGPNSIPDHLEKFLCVNPNFIPKSFGEDSKLQVGDTAARNMNNEDSKQAKKEMKKQARKEERKEARKEARKEEKAARKESRKEEKATAKEIRKDQMKELRKEARKQLMEEMKGTEAPNKSTLRQKIRQLRKELKQKRILEACDNYANGEEKTYNNKWYRKHCPKTDMTDDENEFLNELQDTNTEEPENTKKERGNKGRKRKGKISVKNGPVVVEQEEENAELEAKENEINNQTLALLNEIHETHEEEERRTPEEVDIGKEEDYQGEENNTEGRSVKKHRKRGRKIKKWRRKVKKNKGKKIYTKEMKLCCRQGLEHRKLILFLKENEANSTLVEDCSTAPKELLVWAKFKFEMEEEDCSIIYTECCQAWKPNLLLRQEMKEAKKLLKQMKLPESSP